LLVPLLAAVLTGCTPNCLDFENSTSSATTAAPSPRKAVEAWAPTAPDGFSTDPASWTPSKADPLVFVNGDESIEVAKATPPRRGYFVISGGTCKP
jgi:hypothetical protein